MSSKYSQNIVVILFYSLYVTATLIFKMNVTIYECQNAL